MHISSRLGSTLLSMIVVALSAAAAPAAQINATLSAREAYVGAPITLRVEIANASSHDEPALPDVVGLDIRTAGGPSRSTQTTIINGRRTDRTSAVYVWRIIPRREGLFVVPAITVKVDGQTQTTQPLRFVATKSETGDLLLVEVTGQQQKIYVGQPLELTLNLWIKPYRDAEHQLTVSEGDMWQMISSATNWGVFTDRLTDLADQQQRPAGEEVLRKDASGVEHGYYRYQVEATIYPKRPGRVDAGDVQVVVHYPTRLTESRDPFASMFDDDFFKSDFPFNGRGSSPFNRKTLSVANSRPVVANATVAPIEVTPIPTAGRPADYRGAVGQYQIATHAAPTSVKAGDPITLHVGVSGNGPMDLVQAPPLAQLPQLVADFKVTNEPLAGLVEGKSKVFTTSIRPRRAGIRQIPAIPLSFFDPGTEKFVTVQSEPIAIQVDEADRLAIDAIIGGNSTGGSGSKTSEQTTPQLDLTNYTGNDVLVSKAAENPWPLILALVFPPLVVISLWAARHRRRLIDAFRGTSQRRLRYAMQAIVNATSANQVATAIKRYATSRMGIPDSRESIAEIPAGLSGGNGSISDDGQSRPSYDQTLTRAETRTRDEVTAQLRAHGCDREAEQLDSVLSQCEQAAYAGSDRQNLAALKTAATMALTELCHANPRAAGSKKGADPLHAVKGADSFFVQHRRVLAIVCLLLAVSIGAIPATIAIFHRHAATADRQVPSNFSSNTPDEVFFLHKLTPQQTQTILVEANSAYQQGVKASTGDAATAKEAFSESAAKYQLLVDSGIRNVHLYCNLGNAYLQSGSLGRAIASFQRALLLDPSHTKARSNLDAARLATASRGAGKVSETPTSLSHTAHAFASRLSRFVSPATARIWLAAGWILIWVTMLGGLYLTGRRWRYGLIPVTCLLLIGIALTGIDYFGRPRSPYGIVATQTAVLRQAPGENFATVTSQPLPQGQSLTVLGTRGSWLRVQTPDGKTGWIASSQLEYLDPASLRRARRADERGDFDHG